MLFLPINTSLPPYRWGRSLQLLSGCWASTPPTVKPHPRVHCRNEGSFWRRAQGSRINLPPPPCRRKEGEHQAGMAEKFRGWFKGNRLHCLQPMKAASSPRWHRTCCSCLKLILEAMGEAEEGVQSRVGAGKRLAKWRVGFRSFDKDT